MAERRQSGESGPRRDVWVDGAAARAHILQLRAKRVGYRQVAKLAGVAARTVLSLATGEQRRCSREIEAAILGVTPKPANGQRINGWREHRLLNSLLTEGFSRAEIARRLGYESDKLQVLHADPAGHRFITVENAKKIRRLYEDVNAEGPELPAVRTLATEADVQAAPLQAAHPAARRRASDHPRRLVSGKRVTGQWWWWDPIYRVNLVLLSCPAREAQRRLFELRDAEGFHADFRDVLDVVWRDGLEGKIDGIAGRFSGIKRHGLAVALVWVPPDVHVSTAVHELLHMTAWVLTRAGIEFSDTSEEAFAYYIGWLTHEVFGRLHGQAGE